MSSARNAHLALEASMRHPDQWCSTDPRTRGPIPATVWVCGGSPSDPDVGRPPPAVQKIVTSFTEPGGYVLLLPWPPPAPITSAPLDHELQDALSAVRGLGRTAQVIHTEPEPDRFGDAAAGTDLVITSLSPEPSGDRASDQVASVAARLLRTGGILTVLTHNETSQGQLIDPTGSRGRCRAERRPALPPTHRPGARPSARRRVHDRT